MKGLVAKKKINPKQMHKEFLDSIEPELLEKSVVFFDEDVLNIDRDYLVLPAHITEITSRELGEYLNAFTQQKMYMRTLLGRFEIQLEQAKRNYVTAGDAIYSTLSNSKMSETAKERIINSYAEVKPAYDLYVRALKARDTLSINIANIEDAIFLISREVSRRSSDFDDENRSINVGNR